jgi:hypothetical protein
VFSVTHGGVSLVSLSPRVDEITGNHRCGPPLNGSSTDQIFFIHSSDVRENGG